MNYRGSVSSVIQLSSLFSLYYQFTVITRVHYYNLRAASVRKFVAADGTADFELFLVVVLRRGLIKRVINHETR